MKTVLIIEDNVVLRRVLERALKERYCVTTSTGIGEALARLRGGEAFDVVLCDMFLDDGTGREFYDRLRERSVAQSDRILFMTGHEGADDESPFYRATRGRHLLKPFAASTLIANVEMMAGEDGLAAA